MVDSSKRRLFLPSSANQAYSSLPWIKQPSSFHQDCTQCGDCINVCETKVIVKGSGGFPGINFDIGECTFCYACAESCDESIFSPKTVKPWQKVAEVSDACLARKNIECRSCSDACEPMAIEFQLQIGKVGQPIIDIDTCTGCGGCVSVCPVSAIDVSTLISEGA